MTHQTATAHEPSSPPRSGPRVLKRPPLQEAVFEYRWALENRNGFDVDPHIKLAAGRLSERVAPRLPNYMALPTAELPDALAAWVVQHRWTAAAGGPLLQLGPGVLTVNEARPDAYRWHDFRETCQWGLEALMNSYPQTPDPRSVSFRFINSVPFDERRADVFKYISTQLHGDVVAAKSVLPQTMVPLPISLQSQTSFISSAPPGVLTVIFSTARDLKNVPRLLWQLVFESVPPVAPRGIDAMSVWLDQAHAVLEDVFFRMISGELERSFE